MKKSEISMALQILKYLTSLGVADHDIATVAHKNPKTLIRRNCCAIDRMFVFVFGNESIGGNVENAN